jgi:hypothetical protein
MRKALNLPEDSEHLSFVAHIMSLYTPPRRLSAEPLPDNFLACFDCAKAKAKCEKKVSGYAHYTDNLLCPANVLNIVSMCKMCAKEDPMPAAVDTERTRSLKWFHTGKEVLQKY